MPEQDIEELLDAFKLACLEVFGTGQVIGVVAHGSAVKGGAIPGYSDADFMVFLTSECFDARDARVQFPALPDERAFAMQERIGALPWLEAGFSYPQANFLDPSRMPEWWTGPIPGSYRVLHGGIPEGLEATSAALVRSARHWLTELTKLVDGDVRNFADSPDHQISRRLRLIGTSVTPAVFSLATLDAEDPVSLWAGTKFDALATLRKLYPRQPGPEMAADFYSRVRDIYGSSAFDVTAAREAFKLGVSFLRWAEATARPRLAV